MLIRLLTTALLTAALASAARAADNQDHSEEVFNTGAFNCTSTSSATWTNTKGHSIRINRVRIWPGVSYGARVDVAATLFRLSDGGQIAKLAQDRYAPTNGVIQEVTDLPLGVVITPGDGLLLGYFCNKLGGSPAAQAHFGVDIWWQFEPLP